MLPKGTLTLKQFMKRREVLTLYKEIMSTIAKIDCESDRLYLHQWARDEFKQNKNLKDVDSINYHLDNGKKQFRKLKVNFDLSK